MLAIVLVVVGALAWWRSSFIGVVAPRSSRKAQRAFDAKLETL